ncbi:MAG: hypothetical protein QXS20_09960 [Candidatus Thorarchaeota archaeon]
MLVEDGRKDTVDERSNNGTLGPPTLRQSLRSLLSWSNYRVYLVTSWVFSAFSVTDSLISLYLYQMNWEPLLIGSVFSMVAFMAAGTRLLGGYLGDVTDRKRLAVISFGMVGAYYMIMGLFTEVTFIIIALMIYSIVDLAKGGSSAYILDNIPRAHSGLGLSLFQAGKVFAIVPLVMIWSLVQSNPFPPSYRATIVLGGVAMLVCAFIRARFLSSSTIDDVERSTSLRYFLSANARAVRVLAVTMPGVLVVVVLDAISDSLFHFGALIYSSNYVNMSGIMLTVMTPVVISVPLLLKTGRASDKYSTRRVGLAIYSMMPVSVLLLMLSSVVSHWMPMSVVSQADILLPGLGAIFALPFLGIVLKQVNDSLWWLVILTMVQKSLPRRDTSKILAVFWFLVYVCSSIGPFIGGMIYTFRPQVYLFVLVLALNLIILLIIWGFGLLKDKL